MTETGRRRCGIPEHRKQIKKLQDQNAALWLAVTEANARHRDSERRHSETTASLNAMRRWRFTWPCRWFGHRDWNGRFGSGWCGRCGCRMDSVTTKQEPR